MNIIRNLKIRDKLILLLSLLLIPLIYLIFSTVSVELEESAALEREMVQLEESEKISGYLHRMQAERARILGAVNGDTTMLLQARNYRLQTDAAERELTDFLLGAGRTLPEMADISELKKYRTQLDQQKIDVEEYRDFSAGLIFSLLSRLEDNATGSGNTMLARQLETFRQLVEAKIQLGRARSLMANAINADTFTFQEYANIRSQITAYNRALSSFSRQAGPQAMDDVEKVLTSDNYQKVSAILQAIEADPQMDLNVFDADQTFSLFTKSIEDLRQAENSLIERIRADIDSRITAKQRTVNLLILVFVLIAVLTVTLSIYIINLISSSLAKLKVAADRIKLGAVDVEIDVDNRDEIGSVASSFKGVLNKTVNLSEVAQAIGEGRYDVEVQAQSEEDVLSHAIHNMKTNLQRFTTESSNRNFILTGVSELNSRLSGEAALNTVSEKAISFVSDYTGSEAGVLYLHNSDGKLTPAACYGVPQDCASLPVFEIGHGKVGQAVQQRQVKLLENVADEHLRIKSGLAEMHPASVIIVPLYFADTLIGALELASRNPYAELQQQFLAAISERVAVVIYTLKQHLQTQELLYETQNQAEELETQQEELRQLNAELKASEEELRVNQEELQEKNAELEEKAQLLEEQYEALGAKNKALEDARAAIELKMQQVEQVSKYKSDFLANMSHELRTPLNSILILSRLLADNAENTLSKKQIDHAQIIHKSGNDLLRLINDILDLSKIESGKVKLDTEEVKLRDISMAPLFREVAAKKQIRFTEQIEPGSSESIVTDRFRLEQILRNFIGNALKFTDEGGEVTFSVSPVTDKRKFRSEHLRNHSDILAFSVRDTGIGIPADKQEIVFEAFQQADTSTTRKYGGTGLGLTISKELATILGGELMLESEPGKGSTFTLYLPRVPQQVNGRRPEPAPVAMPVTHSPVATTVQETTQEKSQGVGQVLLDLERQDRQDIKVLIVEDDKGFSDILADFARAKNFEVYQVYTGKEGLKVALEKKPDAMLLDIQLPDMSGWDVLRQVRETKELRHLNVHVMSAYDREVLGEHAENEEYLPKPVTLEMLNKAFSSIVQNSGDKIENILIVEDNEIENRAVAELLLAHGLKSTSAYSAEEAEQVLAKQKVDCIILDLNLPGMKGYDWMKKVKSQNGLADIPIIIYSGKDLSKEEEAQLKKFANTIIIKNEYSYLRLLDEVQLFLHKVNQKLPHGREFKMKLHVPEEVLRGKKVLVVDDDVRNIYSLSSLLELHGMEVEAAYDGREALEKLNAEPDVDLVLMDIMMPEMDGIEATKRIRAISRFKQLPIIALTAKAMKEDREKCIEAGASDYIPKPVDTDKLLTLMRVWLYEA
ncbi:signal transduction histidine kinase [Pontibacter mucosus]|uniref:histidine kinase n=1 Tax=Pontibacter mucosus TaxID=1649266 RepID=A0A2T5YP89_9BACT|nr:response regulator [Pontibacter mucosus]PTX21128.1 signal transduction histidine kinase [Pontibacter mucosus]